MDILISNEQNIDIDAYYVEIEKAIHKVIEVEKIDDNCEVSLTFTGNEEIRELNRDYRGIDSVTDVLSFPIEDEFEVGIKMLGDIVISVERAITQSEEYGHSVLRELIYLVVHSMLHLLGYDHIDEDDKKFMRDREKFIMNELGIYKGMTYEE